MPTKAEIIADNESPDGVRITSFLVTYPRIILAELNTHRVIAKSSASSRALPVKKKIAEVAAYPFIPTLFGKNKKGMQADETLNEHEHRQALEVWNTMITASLKAAALLEKLGVHKQLANRILEPYSYTTTVLTGTEWSNFFKLRDHADAQPEFQELAHLMKVQYDTNVPYYGQEHHLPFVRESEDNLTLVEKRQVSAARCARTSYLSFETGFDSSTAEDLALCQKLINVGHMSPFDHVATADKIDGYLPGDRPLWVAPEDHRHLYGWIPYRVELEGHTPHRRISL